LPDLGEVRVPQGVLELRLADARADLEILARLHAQRDLRHALDARVDAVDHPVNGGLADAEGLEIDQHPPDVDGGIPLDPVIHVLDVLVLPDEVRHGVHALRHRGVGNVG
jgi:hypothetical protein